MQDLFITGDVDHALAVAFVKFAGASGSYCIANESKTRRPEYEIIIDFNLFTKNISVDSITRVRENTRVALQRLAEQRALKYIHVYCEGSANDAAMVRQFRDDYGINACLVNLGVLYGQGIASKVSEIEDGIASSDGIIRFLDDVKHFRTTSLHSAAQAVLFVLENGKTFTGTLHAMEKNTEATRMSVLAARMSVKHVQPRRHFIFHENSTEREFVALF